MKKLAFCLLAAAMVIQVTGCSRSTTVSSGANSSMNSSRPIPAGVKPANQVSPCCRGLAEGRISLDQCMENPACVANNRMCCMNAIQ